MTSTTSKKKPKPAVTRRGTGSGTKKSARKTAAKAKTAKGAPKQAKTPKAKPSKPAAAKRAPTKRAKAAAAPTKRLARADFGGPTASFFTKQPPGLRPIVEALRDLIEEAAPEASSSLKWGMPVYEIGGTMMCAVGAHKAHVNLIWSGAPDAFDDPDGRLVGAGKTGRHLKLTRLDELPRAAVKAWLHRAAQLARGR